MQYASCDTTKQRPQLYLTLLYEQHQKKEQYVSDNAAQEIHKFLGTVEKLRKATISFVVPVCLSVRPYGTTWLSGQIFM